MNWQTLQSATPHEVWRILAEHVRPGRAVSRPIEDAIGAVLAADVRARGPIPAFDRSIMDGYAVRLADFRDGHARLRCRDLARAGAAGAAAVEPGTCVQINTGAPIPVGAEAVVIIENATSRADGFVELADRPTAGQNIERRGGILSAGDCIAHAHTRVRAGTAAALVAGDIAEVSVFEQPEVCVVVTGDELVGAGDSLGPGQIRDSNSIALRELIREAGGRPTLLGRAPDEPDALRGMLERGLSAPLLCVSGGMSKGTHDLVPAALGELGVRWLVESLKLKPGKPTRIGVAPSGAWVIGLPGNPVSCCVCFLLFARALLDGLQGLPIRRPPHLRGVLDGAIAPAGGRDLYQPARWSADERGPRVHPLPWRGSGDPFGLAGATALLYLPAAPRGEAPPPTSEVEFLPLDAWR